MALLKIGFQHSKGDHSLFVWKQKKTIIVLLVYVDDIVVTGYYESKMKEVKSHLHVMFGIKDLGFLKFFLGVEVIGTQQGLVLNQRKYALEILEECGLLACKPSKTRWSNNW